MNCKECGQPMLEICSTGITIEIGEYRKNDDGVEYWYQTGLKSQKLYQCPEDKSIAVD